MAKKVSEPLVASYVPRHLRLGVCCGVPEIEGFQDVLETIPVVDDNGDCVMEEKVLKPVRAVENMAKYKASEFRLSKLQRAGVPLELINVNGTKSMEIDKLLRVCDSVEGVENYLKMVEQQRKERESWFAPVEEVKESVKESVNETIND